MTNLVFARNGQALTTSKLIAEGTETKHHAVMQLIRNYRADFEAFGVLAFEMPKPANPQGGRPETIAILNEQQATLLVTYCKNTETVRKFKVALVKAFYEMRQQLQPQCPAKGQLPPPMLTEQQAYAIMSEVAKRAKNCGAHYQTIYRALKARYQVTKYTHIPREMFDDAISFIRTVNLRVPEAEPQKHEEPEEKRYVVTESFLERQRVFVYYWRYLFRGELEIVIKLMRAMESPHAGMLWDAVHDMNMASLEDSLAQLGFPVTDLNCYKHWLSHQPA